MTVSGLFLRTTTAGLLLRKRSAKEAPTSAAVWPSVGSGRDAVVARQRPRQRRMP